MYSVESFKDLLNEIEIANIRIKGLIEQRKSLMKLVNKPPSGFKSIDYSGMPKGSNNSMPMDRIIELIATIDDKLTIEYLFLNNLHNTYSDILNKINKFQGIKYKIAYKRVIENKTYKEIADELNMNESYVRRIGAKI